MLNRDNYRGVFVIVTTPFTDDDTLDETGLVKTLEFCLAAGVQGVVANANASEGSYLSEAERRRIAEITVEQARGKAVTVIGVSTACAALSVPLARHSEEIGADAIMAMPPTFQKPVESEIKSFYQRLSSAVQLPLILQNFSGPGGTPMSGKLVADLVRELPNAPFVKEETDYPGITMSEIMSLAGDRVQGIMGGKGGLRLMDEFRRGACGTMPACEMADVHTRIWQALEAGDQADARRMYGLLLPLVTFGIGYGATIYKEILYRRGVIQSPKSRQTGGRKLDGLAGEELSAILDGLRPLMMERYRP